MTTTQIDAAQEQKAQQKLDKAEELLSEADRILEGKGKKASEAVTDIVLIVDRSGSMQTTVEDAIGGMRSFVQEQKKAPGTARLTIHHFDTSFDTVMEGRDLGSVEAEEIGLVPRGGTALLDAMGRAITAAKDRAIQSKADLVVFVTVTDGGENASREWTKTGVQQLVSQCERDHDWQFVFIGSNIDAIQEGGAVGVRAANSIQYSPDARGNKAVYGAVARNVSAYRCSGQSVAMSFTDDQRREADSSAEVGNDVTSTTGDDTENANG